MTDHEGARHSGSATALRIGAAATGAAAVAVDVLANEQPSHTIALAVLVSAIVRVSRRIAPRFRGLLQLLNATVILQPALHLAGKMIWDGPGLGPRAAQPELLHSLMPDGLTGGQLVLSLLVVFAVLTVGRMAELVVGAVRRRVRSLLQCHAVSSPRERGGLVRVERRGSSLCSCGWALLAALRGPPHAALPAV